MKKKYIGGIVALFVLALVAVGVVMLNAKYNLNVSSDAGYSVSVKDVELDQAGRASVSKGKQIVFAVTLDKDYSDSNVKVKANDELVSAQNGVYRYTVEKDTTIKVEGVAKNDHIVSGVDVDPGTMEDKNFTILKDKEGKPVPVLSDLGLNGVDTYDVPDVELTASVSESINPGWKYRMLTEINLGKYQGLKFFVKNSNYLQAKLGNADDFFVSSGSEAWNEFYFKYEDGAVNLYINNQLQVNCNYLSDIQLCLQDVGSYKFSNIYVVERKDYKGADVTVEEGDGYYIDLPAREYALNAKLTFHVTIDDDFKKSASFAVKADGKMLKANDNGSYTFVLKKDTIVSVTGVVAKPLDSRYQVVDMPLFVDATTTSNYAMMQSVKGAKTYSYSQALWGYVSFPEVNLEKYNSLLFFIKKDDTDENSWISMTQKADDGTETPFLQTNDNRWHRIEFKKEGGKIYFYADKVKYETPVIDAEHFMYVFNDNSKVRFTSMVGIIDQNYKEPAPDYLSSKYQAIDMPVLVDAKEIDNYELVKKVKGAKTYSFTPTQWCSLAFNYEVDFNKYTDLTFFIKKEDKSSQHWIVLSKVDAKGASTHDYITNNNNRWYKVDLKKVKKDKFDVYVNGIKHESTVSKADDLRLVLNEDSVITFTSLMGIKDKTYKEPTPDYLSAKYQAIDMPVLVDAKEVDNYELVKKVKGAKTYSFTPTQWCSLAFNFEVDFNKYTDLTFFVKKEDRKSQNWIVLSKVNAKGTSIHDYIANNDNRWYKVDLKKVKKDKFDVYVNGIKHESTVSKADDLRLVLNEDSVITFTSLMGIKDKTYKEPTPDYLSAKYQAIDMPVLVDAKEVDNYELVKKVKGAKTYSFTPTQWCSLAFNFEVDFNKYTDLTFFVKKEDRKSQNWIVLSKVNAKGASIHDYIANNDNRWYKVDLKKVKKDKFDVYVNGIKKESTVSKADDLRLVLNEDSVITFTSLMGIKDKTYKEETPNYLSTKYKGIASPIAIEAKEIDNYVLVDKISGSKTYRYKSMMWQKIGFADVNLDAYKEMVFFIHKEDRNAANWIVLQKENKQGEAVGQIVVTNDNKWYKVELKKAKNGKFNVYVNGEDTKVTVSSTTELKFALNENSTIVFTSLVGVKDTGYKEPEPDYVSSDYQTLTYALAVEANETVNYNRLNKVKDAKTYLYTASQWGEIGFGEIELVKYKEVIFFLHKEDMNTANWLEFYKKAKNGDHVNYIQNNDNQWYEVILKKQNSGNTFDVYVNGEKQSGTITDISELKVTINANSTIKYTSLCGIKDPNYQEAQIDYLSTEYKTIAPVVAETATEIDVYNVVSKIDGAKTYSYTAAAWGPHNLLDVDFAPYKSLVFYLKKADLNTGNWLEFFTKDSEPTYYLQCNDNAWYKFELRKNADGKFDVYVNDTKKDHAVAGPSELQIQLNANSVLYFTSLFAIADPNYTEPEPEVRGNMVVMAPWALEKGTMSNGNAPKNLGYTYATVISGGNESYAGATMMDVDLSVYTSFRFALKSTDNRWWEIGKTKDNTYNLIADCSSDWVEYEFKNEDDKFVLYINKQKKDITLDTTANLADLQMKFADGGLLYMTEVRGELKEGSTSTYKKVADNFNTYTEVFTDSERPNALATGSTVTTTTYTANQIALADLSLASYKKLIFYARKTAGNGWFESDYLGTQLLADAWTEFKLLLNEDGTWNTYRGGKLISSNIAITNLSDITAKYGDATYVFSEVFGVEKETTGKPVPALTDSMIVATPWAYSQGTLDNTKTWAAGGYEYATVVSGSNDTFAGALMSDVDLSVYKEVRFAFKSDGSSWYEIGKVADNNFGMIADANGSWVEMKLVEEDGVFRLYKKADGSTDNGWTQTTLPLNMNLSDLQMKFGAVGTLLMTEVRGTLRDGAKDTLKAVAKSFNTLTGDVSKTDRPVAAATESTVVTTSWTASEAALSDVNLAKYNKVIFYARKTAGGGWFESTYFGAGLYGSGWIEHKMVRKADNTWTLYRGGVVAKDNVTADNLSVLTAKYGDATYVFSEVFAMEKPAAKEGMIVATPWAYSQGTLDNTKTWAAGGYEYATVVSGSNDTFAGALMSDVDLSVYKEVRFAFKSDGSSWYEIGKVADNNFGMIADANGSWVEMKLVEEDGVFRLYKKADGSTDNGWTQTTLPLNMNLSDLQMKFGTAGTLLMTEVRGTLRDGAKDTLKAVAKSFNTLTGDASKTDRPVAAATESTVVTTSWTASEAELSDVNLAKYNKVIFYARKTAGEGYFESTYFEVGLYGSGWVEHKMVREADNTWTLYRGGVAVKDNVTADNLSVLTAKYGNATYVFSEVFAVEK